MLIYKGKGDFIAGVPARDLNEAEIIELGLDRDALIASGLYGGAPKSPKTKRDEREG